MNLTNYQFDIEFDKILKAFPSTKYSEERKILIYEHVQNLTQFSFARIVRRFIGGRQAPIPDDFRDAAYLEQKHTGERSSEKKIACPQCDGAGLFTLNLHADQQPYAYVCDCEAGERGNFSKLIPRYQRENNVMEMK